MNDVGDGGGMPTWQLVAAAVVALALVVTGLALVARKMMRLSEWIESPGGPNEAD